MRTFDQYEIIDCLKRLLNRAYELESGGHNSTLTQAAIDLLYDASYDVAPAYTHLYHEGMYICWKHDNDAINSDIENGTLIACDELPDNPEEGQPYVIISDHGNMDFYCYDSEGYHNFQSFV